MKCSADDDLRDDDFSFALSLKNYNDLRAPTLVPRILVVVRVPRELDDWIHLTEDELRLRHCAYWRSLAGEPNTDNEDNVTVRIARAQRFDPSQLTAMMARIDAGGEP